MTLRIKFQVILLVVFLFQNVTCQDDEDYDEEEGEVEVPSTTPSTTTTKKVDPYLNLNFMEQFALLTSQVDNINVTKNETTNGTTTIPTTRAPKPRSTTELNRGEEIGSSVNGILSSVTSLDIPGIVDNALSIRRNNDEVRKFVMGIMTGLFCSPVLSLLSSCGNRFQPDPATQAPVAVGAASP